MTENKFTKWTKWENRDKLDDVKYPGVYCIAFSEVDVSKHDFEWIPQIEYIGMTNSRNGLKGRLNQFDNTLLDKQGHGGADRFRYGYKDMTYQDLARMLFVSVCHFPCDVKSNSSKDLRIMGEVAKFEYDCLATYVEKFNRLPNFNDKDKAPKYSSINKKSR